MNHNRRILVRVAAATAVVGVSGLSRVAAQPAGYPAQTLTMIVPFGAGGPPDAYTRLFALKLEKRIGQRIVVENRPGANSVIGTGLAARARPDGYTVLYATNSSLSAAPALFKAVNYDPVRDFSGVMITGEGYFALIVPGKDKGLTLPQLLERLRREPESNAIGGSSTTAEVLNKSLQNGAKLTHTYVRYAASAKMMTDLIGGRLGAAFQPVVGLAGMIKAGTVHMVAVAAPRRLPLFPDVPTISETVPDIDFGYWNGFFVPAGTPRDIIEFLHRHMQEVLQDPEIVRLTEEGGVVLRMGPAETDSFVRKEVVRWRDLLRGAGIEPS